MQHDLTNKVFGRWVALTKIPQQLSQDATRWNCRCICGTTRAVRTASLVAGISLSCGCLGREAHKHNPWRKHGHCHSPEWRSWASIRDRCNNPRTPTYDRYGGRGISICARWNEFINFLSDMGPRPSPVHSVDRIDNNGNYEPGNCRWATEKEQARNRRSNLLFTVDGETLPLACWVERAGLKYSCVSARLHRGWSLEDALSKPHCSRGRKSINQP